MAPVNPPTFNGPVETGLRALIILYETHPIGLDLQRLVTLDYLLVHSSDVPGGPPSVHPPSPLRAGEVAVRRRLVEDGLHLYRQRGLIHHHTGPEGFEFVADDAAAAFLDSFVSDYVPALRDRATWVVRTFGRLSNTELSGILSQSIGRWSTEFAVVGMEDSDEG